MEEEEAATVEEEEEGEDKLFDRFWKERASPSINNWQSFARTWIAMRLFSPPIYPITTER